MINIPSIDNYVTAQMTPSVDVKAGDVGEFDGIVFVYLRDTAKGNTSTVVTESPLASGTAGESISFGHKIYFDKDNKKIYKLNTGSGGNGGTHLIGYALSSAEADGEVFFRFMQNPALIK